MRRLHAEVTGALPGDRHREDPFGNRADPPDAMLRSE